MGFAIIAGTARRTILRRQPILDRVCPARYNKYMKYELRSTRNFQKWLRKIRDQRTKEKILVRLDRMTNGNFGDYKQISSSLFELRFFFGGGIRIYYTIRNNQVVILLVGGNKSSQQNDIQKAKRILDETE